MLLFLGACPDDQAPAGLNASASLPSFAGSPPGWVGEVGEVVARVGAIPIYKADLERQLDALPGVAPRDALDALIEGEVLAQEAIRRQLNTADEVRDGWRSSLVREYLDTNFEPGVPPESVPAKWIADGYKRNRTKFKRAKGFVAVHVQFLCCMKSTDDCGASEAIECMASSYPLIVDVHRQAVEALAGAEGDPESMAVAFESFAQSARAQFPALAWQRFPFFYERDVPHEEQRGRYPLVDEAFAAGVIDLPLGVLSQPIKSGWGWHVAVLVARHERVDRKSTDPDVVSEIRELAHPAFRRASFTRRVGELARGYKVKMSPDELSVLDAYWGE